MSTHTPGPWHWDGYHLVNKIGDVICDDGSAYGEYGPCIDTEGPDARLLAAAPDLLAALRSAVAWHEEFDRHEIWLGAAHAAIAKAEGTAA